MPLCIFNHPFLLAAAAVVAIGVVVYEIITSQEEKNRRHRSSGRSSPPDSPRPPRRRPSPPPPPRYPPDSPRPPRRRPSPPSYPPDSPRPSKPLPPTSNETSADSTIIPSPNSAGNNLRKRNVNQISQKKSSSADSKSEAKVSQAVVLKERSETLSSKNINDKKFDDNNYSMNVLDKLINDTKDIDENFRKEKILAHNIYEEESDSSEDNLLPKPEKKINQTVLDKSVDSPIKTNKRRRRRKSKNAVEKATQNHYSNCHQTESSSESHSDLFENILVQNKKKCTPRYSSKKRDWHVSKNVTDHNSKSHSSTSSMHSEIDFDPLLNIKPEFYKKSSSSEEENYKKELQEALKRDLCNKGNNPDSSSVCSSEKAEKEKLTDSFCKACEENHINTRAYPCNHSFLCVDCAVKIFRLYKKCSICLGDVVEFVQFQSQK